MPRSSSNLGNPITALYREVSNTRGTWVDAVFWFGLGLLVMYAIEALT